MQEAAVNSSGYASPWAFRKPDLPEHVTGQACPQLPGPFAAFGEKSRDGQRVGKFTERHGGTERRVSPRSSCASESN